MSCDRFAEAISDHACGSPLDEATGRHLATCAECRHVLEERRQVLETAEDDLCRALDVRVSAGFAAEAVRRAHAAPERAPATYRWWMGAAAAAIVALVVWLGVRPVPPAGRRGDLSSGPPTAAATPPLPRSPGAIEAGRVPSPRAGAAVVGPKDGAASTATAARASEPSRRGRRYGGARRSDQADGAATAGRRTREPEVIVPAAQARAIARLRELVDTGVLDGATLPPAAPLGSEPAPLRIVPLDVPEIVIPDVERTNDTDVAGTHGPREMELAQ